MRICVVGCGAIGGLYAAHLAAAARRRGVGVSTPPSRARRGDQPRRAADHRRTRELTAHVHAAHRRGADPAVRARDPGHQGHGHRGGDRRHRRRVRRRRGVQRAERDRQRGGHGRARAARDARRDAARRARGSRPGSSTWTRPGRPGSGRSSPQPAPTPRSAGWRDLLNAAGMETRVLRRRPRRAVDQAAVQRLDQPAVRADRPHPRRAVRPPADPRGWPAR